MSQIVIMTLPLCIDYYMYVYSNDKNVCAELCTAWVTVNEVEGNPQGLLFGTVATFTNHACAYRPRKGIADEQLWTLAVQCCFS